MAGPAASIRHLKEGLEAKPLLMDGQAAEFGNPSWEKATVRVLIIRLSPFDDVCRSTPHLFLFQACRSALPGAYLDFAFFPSSHDRTILEENGLPFMYGVASQRGMREFDIALISNAYTLELINLPLALSRSGIPPSVSLRSLSSDRSPLIILGGSNTSACSSLLEDPVNGQGDSLVDAIFFGEGDAEVPALLASLGGANYRSEGFSAEEKSLLLAQAAQSAPGLFYPGKRERTPQARSFALKARPFVPYPILNSPEASSYKLSLSSGCPSFCGFCMESWDRKPYREQAATALLEEARFAKRLQGASTIDLASFNFNVHSDIVALMSELSRLFFRQNAMSQRADLLEGVHGLLSFEYASGKRSFTVGVEGISQRMRRYYAKELDTEVLLSLLSRLISSGAREIKLFYIVSGLENEEDLGEFASFVKELKSRRADSSSATRIVFSSGYLTRMPGTPLAFAPLALDEAPLRRISGPLKSSCDTNGFEFRMPAFFDEYALGQILALGSPGLFRLLIEMSEKGFCYDKNLDRGAWEFARTRLESQGILNPLFLGEKTEAYPFSLAFLNFSTDLAFRYERYLSARSSLEPARGKLKRIDKLSCLSASCLACGACPPGGQEKAALLGHSIAAASAKDAEKVQDLMKRKAKADIVNVRIDIPAEFYGAESAFLSAYYFRKILADVPDQADNILECEECIFALKECAERFPAFTGPSFFRLRAYDGSSLRAALAALPWLSVHQGQPALQFALSGGTALVFLTPTAAPVLELETCFSAYLREELVPYTLSRGNGRLALWAISREGLKKRVCKGAVLSNDSEYGPLLEVDFGSRFDFSRILKIHGREFPKSVPPRIRLRSIDPECMKPC